MELGPGHGRPFDLTYCGNVHPGDRLSDILAALDAAQTVGQLLGRKHASMGLWLSRSALAELDHAGGAGRMADELARRDLRVFTMNGFPFGDFHAEVVKRAVYHPDWTTDERLDHTASLARLLATICKTPSATLSTLPLAHAGEVNGSTDAFMARAVAQLGRLVEILDEVAEQTGTAVRVCIEPEPGCLLERTEDAIAFWQTHLLGSATAAQRERIGRHLGLCFDTCHQAVVFEDARHSLEALTAAGVPIGKMQLSSALVIEQPGSSEGRAALARFDEPRFLHQVRTRDSHGRVHAADDIGAATELPDDAPWRVHYHVPIHRQTLGEVTTTRSFLEDVIDWLTTSAPALPHLEVETYTWTVLPETERPGDRAGLCAGIAEELRWVHGRLGESP